jgi:hypothetical protein
VTQHHRDDADVIEPVPVPHLDGFSDLVDIAAQRRVVDDPARLVVADSWRMRS